MTGPDRLHRARICPDCGGLVAGHLDRIGQVRGFRLEAGPLTVDGSGTLYIGPAPEPCQPRETSS